MMLHFSCPRHRQHRRRDKKACYTALSELSRHEIAAIRTPSNPVRVPRLFALRLSTIGPDGLLLVALRSLGPVPLSGTRNSRGERWGKGATPQGLPSTFLSSCCMKQKTAALRPT